MPPDHRATRVRFGSASTSTALRRLNGAPHRNAAGSRSTPPSAAVDLRRAALEKQKVKTNYGLDERQFRRQFDARGRVRNENERRQ
jgi:hypothetical protein